MPSSKALDAAIAIVQAEIAADTIAARLKPVVIEKPIIIEKPQKPAATEFVDMTNQAIATQETLLDEDGEGTVEKILIRSPNPNFSIILIPDYGDPLQGSYTNFQDVLSWQETDTGTYVLEITNITFTKNIKFTITVTQPITFSRIYIKYQIKRKQ